MAQADGEMLTTTLVPACPGGPVLIYAISGLGKSTLAATHPTRVLDADEFLNRAVEAAFPELTSRSRLLAWRELCGRRPWVEGGPALQTWASVRRAFTEPLVAAMRSGNHAVVVTSLLKPPWVVSAYYGVERGRYMEHLELAGRKVDNKQSEAMNNRLDGYSPLIRLGPGQFLAERREIRELVGGM